MEKRIVDYLIAEFSLKPFQIENTIQLLDEGSTIPFIARYRKEKTGELDEVQIQAIRDRYHYLQELEQRKVTILETIEKAGKLTAELRQKILQCMKKQELEDLYLPYRPKRRTRATIAREKGLEPLAGIIREYAASTADPGELCAPFIDDEKGVATMEDALQGAQDILAEEVSENSDFRKFIRKVFHDEGRIVSKVKKDFEDRRTKFEMYYDHSEPLKNIPSHRFLAMRRGEKEAVLSLDITGPDERILGILENFWIKQPSSYFAPLLRAALHDGYKRLIQPSISVELMVDTKNSADDDAIVVFEKNLRNLLLLPPGGQKITLGVDPGFRTGCKCAVVDATGKFCEFVTIYPVEPFHKLNEAETALLSLIKKYTIEVIAIGNGTASRETLDFIKKLLGDFDLEDDLKVYVVNEAGASVYSASEIARDEFPDLDVSVRGAISIARRFQDPLAELVKIDPKSIGVGQYQHDVNQRKLKQKLGEVVQFVVNRVGVELNSASSSLLEYVSGITPSLARGIVQHRFENGPFPTRESLLSVSRFGEKTYEQSAGFLRIRDGENPLDSSAVHPESYPIVQQMAADLGVTIPDLLENDSLIGKIEPTRYCTDDIGLPTLHDILAELKKPGRDPRAELTSFEFESGISELSDLQDGMILPGIVTNVTNFGAFVDIGVHQDGLVHISQMGRRYVKNPYEVCSVGQKITVKVISVDTERKRIGLSMKVD